MTADLYFSVSVISIGAVNAVLDGLGYTTGQVEASDLYSLKVVDEFLQDPTFPRTLHDRHYAISVILTTHITQQLHHLASMFELALPKDDESFHKAIFTIEEYARTQNPELIGWCWLYYRYVRTELHMQAKVFSELCSISERTLRRYQLYAVKRLTETLIYSEWELRRQHFSISSAD